MTFPTKPEKLVSNADLPEVLPVPLGKDVMFGHLFLTALRATTWIVSKMFID